MARHNNISRSLVIMSKANGWDPTEMLNKAQVYKEDLPTAGEYKSVADCIPSDGDIRKTGAEPWVEAKHRNANPYPGKPGAA